MKKFYNRKLLFITLFGFLFNVNILFANQVDVTFENGDRYIGEVLNNKKHGSGTYIESGPDGKEYKGEWKNDKQHGKGFLRQSGMEYTGDFFEGKIQGKGVLVDKDGKYEGEFLNGMMHGIGVLKLNDGRIVRGEFKNNKYVGASKKMTEKPANITEKLDASKATNILEDKIQNVESKLISENVEIKKSDNIPSNITNNSEVWLDLEKYWLNVFIKYTTSPTIALMMTPQERNFLANSSASCLDVASRISHKKGWTISDKYNEFKATAPGQECKDEEYKPLIYQILEQKNPFEGGLNNKDGKIKDVVKTKIRSVSKLFANCIEETRALPPSKRPPKGNDVEALPYHYYCVDQILARKISDQGIVTISTNETQEKSRILDNYDSSSPIRTMKCLNKDQGGYWIKVELMKDQLVEHGKDLYGSPLTAKHEIVERQGNDVAVIIWQAPFVGNVTSIYDFKNKKLTQSSTLGKEVMECI